MIIRTFTRTHYGSDHTYIKDVKVAECIAQLTNKKTVSELDLMALAELGHDIQREDGSRWIVTA